MKKIILILLLLALAVGGWYVYSLYSGKNPDLAEAKPDHSVTATELLAAFDRDSASSARNYVNAIVRVSGTVTRIDTSGVITLGRMGEMSTVECMLDARHRPDLALAKEGQPVTLQGRCTGYKQETMLDVNLGTTVEFNFCAVVQDRQ